LRTCLSSLELQCLDDAVEVLVIDNNSTDATSSIAHEFSNRLPNFKYILEEKQGVSHTRNRGFQEALGAIVAYIDDDAKANPDWVSAITHFFENHPEASGVGGQHNAFSLVPIPPWFPKEYGSRSLGNETRKLRKNEWLNGTNMAFKKSALVDIGGFDNSIGMTGDKISYGEETQLVFRMFERGMQIYYSAEMCVTHSILPKRLILSCLLFSYFANGYDCVKVFSYKGNAISFLPSLIKGVGRALVIFLRCKEQYFKTRIYRSLAPLCSQIGFFVKLLGL